MYSDAKIKSVIETLISGTESGYIKWAPESSIFNSDTRHKMGYTSDDGLTEFTIEVELDDSLLRTSGGYSYLYIRNDDLVDDKLQIASSDFKRVKELRELIFQKFIRPKTIKNPPKIGVLDDILGNINLGHMREQKIDDMLEDESTSEEPTEKKKKKWGWF